jgi:hypothetical protein
VHPVFHPSLLEPFTTREDNPHPQEPIIDTLRQHSNNVFDVERILDRRQNAAGQWEYLIKWLGYEEEENTWEPGAAISAEALKAYWKRLKVSPRRSVIKIPATTSEPKKRRGRPPKKKGDGVKLPNTQ